MRAAREVALLIETSNRYARELLRGVRVWVREHEAWTIRLTEQGRGAAVPDWLRGWDGDGVIARVESVAIARQLRATGLPVIDVSAALTRLAIPLDLRGQQVLVACRLAGLTVPDEVAVIGVHNDELLCDLCDPPLSSVMPNAQRAGYEAAELLPRAMAGKKLARALHQIAPLGVAARQSTDIGAVGDTKIAGAVRSMRQQAASGANVGDVLRAVPMARTALERRFKTALGTSPHAHLRKLRVERVQELLSSTSLPVGEIAAATGFEHPEYLSAMFRRECGMSPRDFRARNRPKE